MLGTLQIPPPLAADANRRETHTLGTESVFRYDSIIFDLDGTLWDAARSSARGWNAALRQAGVAAPEVSADDIRRVSGMPFPVCVSTLFGAIEAVDPDSLGTLIDEHERRAVEMSGGDLYAGVQAGLEALAGRYRLFLISNCQSWYLQEYWKQSDTRRHFADDDCHGDSGRSKAAMIADMLAKNGAERAIYIGDTAGDEKASRAAGVAFGHARYGFGHVDAPDLSFASFAELVERFVGETAA